MRFAELLEGMKPEQVSGKETAGAVEALEKKLMAAKKQGTKFTYHVIDKMMQKICGEYNLTGQKLHDKFVNKHGLWPDNWIKKQKINETAQETNRAQAFIDQVYDQYPDWPYGQADRVMVWGSGEDQQFAAFKLKPGTGANTVEIDWIMAGPEQRKGVGSRAIQELQQQAQAAGIRLTLYPWSHGQISQAALTRLYRRNGFKPIAKGAKPMAWDPVAENFADGKGPGRPGDSQRHGIPKGATMAQLEKASHAKGRKGQLARWQLNMRRGHKK
jgi:GNAT superfamily N-acetyltransferase